MRNLDQFTFENFRTIGSNENLVGNNYYIVARLNGQVFDDIIIDLCKSILRKNRQTSRWFNLNLQLINIE